MRKQLEAGEDPGMERKAEKRRKLVSRANTFEAVAREWYENQKSTWVATHAKDVLRRLEGNLFPTLEELPVSEVEPVDLLATVRKIEERGARDRFAQGGTTTRLVCPRWGGSAGGTGAAFEPWQPVRSESAGVQRVARPDPRRKSAEADQALQATGKTRQKGIGAHALRMPHTLYLCIKRMLYLVWVTARIQLASSYCGPACAFTRLGTLAEAFTV